jgi:ATP-dependent 26S proteasome regulatory subunit
VRQQLIEYIKAGYPGIYIVSYEEPRVELELIETCKSIQRNLFVWTVTSGLIKAEDNTIVKGCGMDDSGDPCMNVLNNFVQQPEATVFLLKDFHLFIGDPGKSDPNPVLIRKIKDVLLHAKQSRKTLFIVGARQFLPAELEKELLLLEFSLPDRSMLRFVLNKLLADTKRKSLPAAEESEVLLAASGLTTAEAESAFALSLVRHKTVRADVVAHEKAATIKKGGMLEIVNTTINLDSIGGLSELKAWLAARKDSFGDEAAKFGVPMPKGCLIVGMPGGGKSLTAKAAANILGVPCLRLDASRVFGSLVGQSEQNMRNIMQTAEAVSPCVMFIDEVEKFFSGTESSGRTDGGTTSRIFGAFLTWMNDKTKPVFVVATANDVDQLPAALLRRGRWDEIWFVDLPTPAERREIWRVVIGKQYTEAGPRRNPADFDLDVLSEATEGFVGSEIEQAFIEAVNDSFAIRKEPNTPIILKAAKRINPLSKLMKEQLDKSRNKIAGNARSASAPGQVKAPPFGFGRKIEEGPQVTGIIAVVEQPRQDNQPGSN